MYHIAIVEDEEVFSRQLTEYLDRYKQENGLSFTVSVFKNGEDIVKDYRKDYDIILLDIDMPVMNGMQAAEAIRQQDSDVVLMFITNMASYALKGYEVDALDFVMKPINYYTFSARFARAVKRAEQKSRQHILITLPDGIKRFRIADILYIEVQNKMLHYHTVNEIYTVRGTMQGAEKSLEGYPFAKCNHWYLVNLMHVSQVKEYTATVGDSELEISRRNKTSFLRALTQHIGGIK